MLYQRAPRNIHRHVVLSEIKEAVAALPPVRRPRGCGPAALRGSLTSGLRVSLCCSIITALRAGQGKGPTPRASAAVKGRAGTTLGSVHAHHVPVCRM